MGTIPFLHIVVPCQIEGFYQIMSTAAQNSLNIYVQWNQFSIDITNSWASRATDTVHGAINSSDRIHENIVAVFTSGSME